MRLHQVTFALALVAVMQVSAAAQKIFGSIDETCELFQARPADTPKETAVVVALPARVTGRVSPAIVSSPVAVPTPLQSDFQNEWHAQTYSDVYRILTEDNPCRRFFSEPAKAAEVFNLLAQQLKLARMADNVIAIRMGGEYRYIQNLQTGMSYRLFEQVLVNSEGPFSIAPTINTALRQTVGRFRLNSKAGWALLFLHELGHLMRGPDGRWLLPNDGNSPQLSLLNTSTVESHCHRQLAAL